ncbi:MULTISPECIES: peptidoglycan bridge formation glycyltransferase FemA/FemB family protein [unclassified Arenibacter]|uniref:peptidoglycan bridge formation glycyltransferase FemA/FemB family protein n=1 Tax=unclassified Arenibacter TaxID=2615047 RepID=UPI000E3574A1|nr:MULTISPECIES: peptidoglycan bridge formation glycyltransferase FemA/FemB family protein [unclassified Arenibacter]MCM4164767.1 GNAT family N-acetyltransferase [Arenibacter sp. A80]RFT55835.1 peptidoglycan bridge formation glycyltransferase FemA/FemB family protein [Arenibacter sp. P308M17]
MIEIIRNKNQWDATLKMVDIYDFYHTYDYHQISKKEDEQAVLVKYSEKDTIIAIPLLLREITGTQFHDFTSVYGYAGPLTKNIDNTFVNAHFLKEFKEYLLDNHIISVFSRLNPFIPNQEICLRNFGEISTMSHIVNIDVTRNLEEQKQAYYKRLKTHINKARRKCYVRMAESKEDVLAYIELYYANMKRVNAKKEYFFDHNYFFQLLDSKDFNARIFLAIEKETNGIIAGAMFIETNKIVQYHLSGSDLEHLNLFPIKLLIDEMRIIAGRENCKFLNLGGGVGSKEDSLFHFKSSFSQDFKNFTIWKCVSDIEKYEALIVEKMKPNCGNFVKGCSHFFPCYRCNGLNNTI